MAGIYIHIPFCHAKCAYCDFYSLGRADAGRHRAFVDALLAEWDARRAELADEPVDTVYLGGGTPSALDPALLAEIIATVTRGYSPVEVTVEANPEDVTPQWADAVIAAGVNRVSMGVQSLVDAELQAVGRRHDAARAVEAFRSLRAAGIDNISCDLIFGLPHQTLDSWRYSVDRLADLAPEHFSAYLLSYEPGTRLNALRSRGVIAETDEPTLSAMYDYLRLHLADCGYQHYEISNYALSGRHSRHNSSYWTATPYLGLGPGAHSYDGLRLRSINPPSLRDYIDRRGLIVEREELLDSQLLEERIMLGLRTASGLDLDRLAADFGPEAARSVRRAARSWIADGALIADNGHLRVDPASWLVSDAIIVDLFPDD